MGIPDIFMKYENVLMQCNIPTIFVWRQITDGVKTHGALLETVTLLVQHWLQVT